MNTVLVVAPHADDETLGCGGTLLRHRAQGDAVHWVLVTHLCPEAGFSPDQIAARDLEVRAVAERYGFAGVHNFRLPPARLDALPMTDLIEPMAAVFRSVSPQILYLPYRGDIHTDHARVFEAAAACTKWFRYPSIRRVLAYETLSETDFVLDPDVGGFKPNVYSDIGAYLDAKVAVMALYRSEMGDFPFPRSEPALRAQAHLRGAAAGFTAAEAFMLLKERM